jgi:hypothetical protein
MRTCCVVHYIVRHGLLHALYPDEIHLYHIHEADVCTHPPDKILTAASWYLRVSLSHSFGVTAWWIYVC